jgi:hypothetical protein
MPWQHQLTYGRARPRTCQQLAAALLAAAHLLLLQLLQWQLMCWQAGALL